MPEQQQAVTWKTAASAAAAMLEDVGVQLKDRPVEIAVYVQLADAWTHLGELLLRAEAEGRLS